MKTFIRIISLFLIFVLLVSNTLILAENEMNNETLSEEYKYGLEENIADVFSDIFANETQGDDSSNGITPRWNQERHEETVDESYGTLLTNFMKTMSFVPDNNDMTLEYSVGQRNYLGLSIGSIITLSDGTEFEVLDKEALEANKINYNNIKINLKERAILHGRGNYVASLRFLYTVAKNLVDNTYTGTEIEKIQQAINASFGTTDVANNTLYGENKTYCKHIIDWTNKAMIMVISL